MTHTAIGTDHLDTDKDTDTDADIDTDTATDTDTDTDADTGTTIYIDTRVDTVSNTDTGTSTDIDTDTDTGTDTDTDTNADTGLVDALFDSCMWVCVRGGIERCECQIGPAACAFACVCVRA